jgi:hypothetical protein
MKRFRAGQREPQPEPTTPNVNGAAGLALEIEELEPRLTPDYFGTTGSGSSGGSGGPGTPPGRTVGWGC